MTIGLLRLWVAMSVCWVVAVGAITWSTLDWTKEWVLRQDWARNVDPAWAEFKHQPDPEHNQKLCYLKDTSSGLGKGDHARALACLKMARQLGIWFTAPSSITRLRRTRFSHHPLA
jgi:hypothetical protein